MIEIKKIYEKLKSYCESIPIEVEKKNRIRIFNNQIIHSRIFDRSFEIESYENKERVPFYMSIPTTMKFIVRGKSVEFFNREGSSPSIPNKKPILLPRSLFLLILFIHFFSSVTQFKQNEISFSFYSLCSFANGSE